MNKIKAAIIEDEIPAARLLKDTLLSLRPDWEVHSSRLGSSVVAR